eukprot:2722777-Pleurochrysis_carterae.AAC.2
MPAEAAASDHTDSLISAAGCRFRLQKVSGLAAWIGNALVNGKRERWFGAVNSGDAETVQMLLLQGQRVDATSYYVRSAPACALQPLDRSDHPSRQIYSYGFSILVHAWKQANHSQASATIARV